MYKYFYKSIKKKEINAQPGDQPLPTDHHSLLNLYY